MRARVHDGGTAMMLARHLRQQPQLAPQFTVHQRECVVLRVLGKCAQKVRFHTAPNACAVPNDVSFSIVSAGCVIGYVQIRKILETARRRRKAEHRPGEKIRCLKLFALHVVGSIII